MPCRPVLALTELMSVDSFGHRFSIRDGRPCTFQ